MNSHLDAECVKAAADGRWREVLVSVAGIPAELLDGKSHPCPWCGGTDRFSYAWPDSGGCNCRKCHATNNSDGLAAVMRAKGCSFPDAVKAVGGFLGLSVVQSNGPAADPIEEMAIRKRCPADSLRAFQARIVGKEVRIPMFKPPIFDADNKAQPCGWQRFHGDYKGTTVKGGKHGLFLPGRTPDPGDTVLTVEGVKDAAVLHSMGYFSVGHPGTHLPRHCEQLMRECHVIVVPDLDVGSYAGAEQTAGRLYRLAKSTRIARLPGKVVAKDGQDVRDILQMPDGEKLVREAIDEAPVWEPVGDPDVKPRPLIYVELNESRVADKVIEKLRDRGIYQRGGQLVHVTRETNVGGHIQMPDAIPRIRKLPSSTLRETITMAVQLAEPGEEEDRLTRPQRWLIEAIGDRGQYPPEAIPPLAGLVRSPTVRLDGTVLQDPGYDDRSGLLYLPDGEYPRIPDHPTSEEAARAMAALLEVVSDFPFADADVHRPVWLALVLTLVCRSAIPGPCPLFTVDANTRGSGKSLLCDAAGVIAFGNHLARKTWPRDDDEVRKAITSVAIEAIPAVLLDNISTTLGSASLDAALTGTTWTDRVLGRSETTGTLPLQAVWLATGNNVVLGADTARRSLLCRLETLEEHPEDRDNFKHRDLLAWVKSNRRRLAAAAVTLVRAYFAAGRPDQSLKTWGSYEAWSSIIREAIVWNGLADPALSRQAARETDRSAELLVMLMAGVEEADSGQGVTAGELAKLVQLPIRDEVDPYPRLRAAVTELCGSRIDGRQIGYKLRSYAGRVCRGRRLVTAPGRAGVMRWSVVGASGGDGGDGGDKSPLLTRTGNLNKRNNAHIRGAETSPPSQPSPPSTACDHTNPAGWVYREGKAFCPACDKYMGRAS